MNLIGIPISILSRLSGLTQRRLNDARAGQTYDLKILIAEISGGSFGYFLFYQLKREEKLRAFLSKPLTADEMKVLSEVNQAVADAL